MKYLPVLILLAVSSAAPAQTKPGTGEIRGTVTYPNGGPVPQAIVYAMPQEFSDFAPIRAKSDGSGSFDFHGSLPFGTYKLYSTKFDEGYPDPFDSFYSDATLKAPEIVLSKKNPAAAVNLTLGRQAAVMTGRILDAENGAPLKAYLGLLDEHGHGFSVFVDGNYRVLLPPGKRVTLMVTLPDAPDHRAIVPVAPVEMEPGQYVYLDLPVPPAN